MSTSSAKMKQGARIEASPTKAFFVQMLTRDIDLKAAILDLLDNCVDGIHRHLKAVKGPKPYKKFHAEMKFDGTHFELLDNCGGITRARLRKSALRLGRPKANTDDATYTVGAYGIGLKRAIFKLGREAEITTKTSKETSHVLIDEAWMDDDKKWGLDLSKSAHPLSTTGTRIVVRKLLASISNQLGLKSFADDLNKTIGNFYSDILLKGFRVQINGVPVKPKVFEILADAGTNRDPAEPGIGPYIFRGDIDRSVGLRIVVGFYREPESADVRDDNSEKSAPVEAGVTVFCNDRVVVLRDRSDLTGWGTNRVPQWHNQFLSICGLVEFSSADAAKLPLTTTKQGLDRTSDAYKRSLQLLTTGLKCFTDFTNKWKKREVEARKLFVGATPMSRPQLLAAQGLSGRWLDVVEPAGGRQFVPVLPLPRVAKKRVQITFSRPRPEIEDVARLAMNQPGAKPNQVGEYCFDSTLRRAKTKR
jgi:histidine kinase/DNA gyrase B/HSP90-like ATPase